jgi:hypothetical protein
MRRAKMKKSSIDSPGEDSGKAAELIVSVHDE